MSNLLEVRIKPPKTPVKFSATAYGTCLLNLRGNLSLVKYVGTLFFAFGASLNLAENHTEKYAMLIVKNEGMSYSEKLKSSPQNSESGSSL